MFASLSVVVESYVFADDITGVWIYQQIRGSQQIISIYVIT